MGRSHSLSPHIKNSHDGERQYHRTFNLLYYMTLDWLFDSGGNLETRDSSVQLHTTVVSKFNRLLIMETNPTSWYAVNEVKVDRVPCCVSNYYFSTPSSTGQNYFSTTSFSPRPKQRLLGVVACGGSKLRKVVCFIAPGGVGRKDIYGDPTK